MVAKLNPSRKMPSFQEDKKGRWTHSNLWKTTIRYSQPKPYEQVHANDNTAYKPEIWAQESVETLVEEMVFSQTVHTDFKNEIAEFGDTVHTREPSETVARRKQNDLDDISTQDVSARKIPVVMDQHIYVSFIIGDGEKTTSFQDLVRIHLLPAIQANARLIDRSLAAEVVNARNNAAGGLNQMTKTNAHEYLLNVRKVLNDNKVGQKGRFLALASRSETQMQSVELFKDASAVGDDGTALREAWVGRKEGFDTFLSLNVPSVDSATLSATTTTVNGNFNAGATTVTFTSGVGFEVGQYVTIAGDQSPLRISAIATNDITFTTALVNNVATGAAVVAYENKLIAQASSMAATATTGAVSDGYPANWKKLMQVDTNSARPYIGQLVGFGTDTANEYVIVDYELVSGDTYNILLDRPLVVDAADNSKVYLGPNGDMNFAYQRDAIALVNRPLELPMDGTGVNSAIGFFNNISLRVVISYDPVKQGHRVTIDGLFGKKTLNSNRMGVLYG